MKPLPGRVFKISCQGEMIPDLYGTLFKVITELWTDNEESSTTILVAKNIDMMLDQVMRKMWTKKTA
jgi:hypothetical protein